MSRVGKSRAASGVVVLATLGALAGCGVAPPAVVPPEVDAAPYEATAADEDAFVEKFLTLPGMDPANLTPALRADLIEDGLSTCARLRADPEQAAMTLGLSDAMSKDNGHPADMAENSFRLAVEHLCPDLEDVAEQVIDEALGS